MKWGKATGRDSGGRRERRTRYRRSLSTEVIDDRGSVVLSISNAGRDLNTMLFGAWSHESQRRKSKLATVEAHLVVIPKGIRILAKRWRAEGWSEDETRLTLESRVTGNCFARVRGELRSLGRDCTKIQWNGNSDFTPYSSNPINDLGGPRRGLISPMSHVCNETHTMPPTLIYKFLYI